MRSPTTHPLSLALDLGNSSTKAAVFDGSEMVGAAVRFPNLDWRRADDMVTNHKIGRVVYSSVANVPPQALLSNWSALGCQVIAIDRLQPLPFTTRYRTPLTLGRDRVAAIAGWLAETSASSGPVTSALVVDAGTCMTVDLVDASGVHQGGNISPGAEMRLRAMHDYTARLPVPSSGEPEGPLGLSTQEALRHGGKLGAVYELEGLISRLLHPYPDLLPVLTGGDGPWLAEKLGRNCVLRPNLVLRGLIALMSNYAHNES